MITDLYVDGVLRERRDDTTRTVTTYDESGALTDTRPYTTDENATADAAAAQAAADAEHKETEDRVRAIIDELKVEKDRMQAVLDTPNSQINDSPAHSVKETAQSAKRIADAAIDLAKYVDGK